MSIHETILTALGDRAKGVTADQLAAALAGWELIDLGGAVVMRNGSEMHAAAIQDVRGRWITRARIKAILSETVGRLGVVTTSVMLGNSPGHAFVRRLGFMPTREADDRVFYELRKVRHA